MSAPGFHWPWPRRLAHRGGGRLAPENTLAAIALGKSLGFRAVEFDVQVAADGSLWLLHDATLDRTTSARGPLAARRAAELCTLDAGAWFGARFAGEPLPTLEQALALCRREGLWPNVEIKPGTDREGADGAAVAAAVQRAYAAELADAAGGLERLPLLSSFSAAALAGARAAAPRLPRGLLVDRLPADWAAQVAAVGAVTVHCNHRRLDAVRAAAIRRAGYGLFCYTVDEPARVQELAGWGVDALCTDRPDRVAPDPA